MFFPRQITERRQMNLIRTLIFRCFRICSSPSLLSSSLDELGKLLSQNAGILAVCGITTLMMFEQATK